MKRQLFLTALVFSLVFILHASSTKVFKEDGFSDFSKGELKTTSLTSEGELFPAPEYSPIGEIEEDLVWRIVAAKDFSYFSTGNEGRIFRVDKKGNVELYCDLEEVAVFALAVDQKGILFAGASPGGNIYRIPEKNKPSSFFETGQEYVWDLAFDPEGNLLAATGNQGKLYQISKDGKGDVYYETPDKNIMDILLLEKINDDSIYLATHDKGKIYRVYEKDRAFVLFDSEMDEIRCIVEGEEGYIYAALNTAKAGPPRPPQKKDEEEESKGADDEEEKEEKKKLALPLIMGKKSLIVKLDVAGYVWPLLLAPETPIHAMIYDNPSKSLLAGIGEKGKLYRIEGRNKYTVLFSVDEKYILSVAGEGDDFRFGTGEAAKLYSVDWQERSRGEYLSPIHDADTAVNWGLMRLRGDFPRGTSLKISTRSGNSKEPDKTWSEWTDEEALKKNQVAITCPVARFLQYKLLLSGRDKALLPVVKKVESFYTPPNRAPVIDKIDIAPPGKRPAVRKPPPKDKSNGNSNNNSKSSNPADTIDALANSNPQKVKITWKPFDPESDKLRFALYFKGEEEKVWKKIEDKLEKPLFEFATDALPDGRYQIKVVASDIPSNPKTSAKEGERISEIFTIDNTPPRFVESLTYDRVEKNAVVVHAALEDDTSIISSAQYSVNAEEWFRVNPEDEIFDSPSEVFSFMISELEQEELVVTLMVTDAEGNTVVEKLRIDLEK